jgi:hypothetical protein
MITATVKIDRITPFVESEFGVNFILDDNESLNATTRSSEINRESNAINTYHTTLNVNPVISVNNQGQSNKFSNLIDINKLNKKIEDASFSQIDDVSFNNENVIFNFSKNQIDNDIELTNIFRKQLSEYNNMHLIKTSTTIKNIRKKNYFDINYNINNFLTTDFQKSITFTPFNEYIDDYPRPTILNQIEDRFEESGVIKILNNYYERVLLSLNANVRNNYIYKINYPLKYNSNVKYFNGAYLDPLEVRKTIEDKKGKFFTGITSKKMFTNIFESDVINTQNNSFFDSPQTFSGIQIPTTVLSNNFQTSRFDVNTNSVFNIAGRLTQLRAKRIKNLQDKKIIKRKQINLGYVNIDHNDKIKPFYDFPTTDDEVIYLKSVYLKKIIKVTGDKISSISYESDVTESVEIFDNETNTLLEQYIIKESFWNNIPSALNDICQQHIIRARTLQDKKRIVSVLKKDTKFANAGFITENELGFDSRVYTGIKE